MCRCDLVYTSSSKSFFINNMFISVCFLGAHSHIRGLGLDDALEPRQVASYVWPCKVFTHLNQNYFIFDKKLSCTHLFDVFVSK